jgi:hypothetical protein
VKRIRWAGVVAEAAVLGVGVEVEILVHLVVTIVIASIAGFRHGNTAVGVRIGTAVTNAVAVCRRSASALEQTC